jgi:preprotein translocase subunit SecG
LLALILATILAVADRSVMSVDRARAPKWLKWVAAIWPYRVAILAALAVLALVLILVQSGVGFGLERATRQVVSEKFAEERAKAVGDPSKLQTISFRQGEALSRFNLERTTWFDLVILFHILVVLAMIFEVILARRGTRPPPRIVLHY